MDFVVVGLGLGAIALLTGVILSGWTAPRAASEAGATAAIDAGHLCLAAGGAIMLATIGALAGALDDRTGAFLVATTATVAALGFLLWGYLNQARILWLAPRRQVRASPAVAPAVTEEVPPPAPASAAAPVLAAIETGTEPLEGQDGADSVHHDDPREPLEPPRFATDSSGHDTWDDHFEEDDDSADDREEAVILGGTVRGAPDDS